MNINKIMKLIILFFIVIRRTSALYGIDFLQRSRNTWSAAYDAANMREPADDLSFEDQVMREVIDEGRTGERAQRGERPEWSQRTGVGEEYDMYQRGTASDRRNRAPHHTPTQENIHEHVDEILEEVESFNPEVFLSDTAPSVNYSLVGNRSLITQQLNMSNLPPLQDLEMSDGRGGFLETAQGLGRGLYDILREIPTQAAAHVMEEEGITLENRNNNIENISSIPSYNDSIQYFFTLIAAMLFITIGENDQSFNYDSDHSSPSDSQSDEDEDDEQIVLTPRSSLSYRMSGGKRSFSNSKYKFFEELYSQLKIIKKLSLSDKNVNKVIKILYKMLDLLDYKIDNKKLNKFIILIKGETRSRLAGKTKRGNRRTKRREKKKRKSKKHKTII